MASLATLASLALVGTFATLSGRVVAKTDLNGCTSTEIIVSSYYASYIYYVPGTGEICSFPDCGGGRAPPKNAPGCAGYTGTETLTPSYLPGFAAKSTDASTAAHTGDSASLPPSISITASAGESSAVADPISGASSKTAAEAKSGSIADIFSTAAVKTPTLSDSVATAISPTEFPTVTAPTLAGASNNSLAVGTAIRTPSTTTLKASAAWALNGMANGLAGVVCFAAGLVLL